MHTAAAHLYTEAAVSLIHFARISPERKNGVKKEALSRLWNATKQPLQIDELIILHLRLGDLCTRVHFRIALQLVVNRPIGTSFIDRFICGVSLPKKSSTVAHATSNNLDQPKIRLKCQQYTEHSLEFRASWTTCRDSINHKCCLKNVIKRKMQHHVVVTTYA